MTPWRLTVIVLVIVAGGVWLAWRAAQGSQMLPGAEVQLGDLSEYVNCRGTLAARQAAVLVAPNRVENLRIVYQVPEGAPVKKGQVVIRLDVSGLQQTANQLALALKTAQATLNQARAQAQVTAQQDRRTLVADQAAAGRARNTAKLAAVNSRIEGEESELTLATAQAQVSAAQASNHFHATASAAQLRSLRQTRDQAAAQLQREQAAIAQASLRAPMPGMVTYSMNYNNFSDPHPYRVGDVVSAGDEIAQIPNLATLEVRADLQQTDRGRVRAGAAVTVRTPALPELELSGQVLRISALTSLDFSGSFPPPRIFRLTASLLHPDPRLRPQMAVTMHVITRQIHHVALVPAQAVFTRNGHAIVYVQQGRRYQPQRVTVLGRNPTEDAIAGVKAGVRVALAQPGAKAPRHTANPAGAAGLAGTQP
ncbi:MAG: efflux RND transporter periplasmic adaptor subunit [Terriglobales bacterium]